MKRLIVIICLVFLIPVSHSGCATTPSTQQVTVTTLKVVGLTAKAGIDSAAILRRDGKITPEQWGQIAYYYDQRLQPAFALAVQIAQADLSKPASPEVLALAAEFAALVAQYTSK